MSCAFALDKNVKQRHKRNPISVTFPAPHFHRTFRRFTPLRMHNASPFIFIMLFQIDTRRQMEFTGLFLRGWHIAFVKSFTALHKKYICVGQWVDHGVLVDLSHSIKSLAVPLHNAWSSAVTFLFHTSFTIMPPTCWLMTIIFHWSRCQPHHILSSGWICVGFSCGLSIICICVFMCGQEIRFK